MTNEGSHFTRDGSLASDKASPRQKKAKDIVHSTMEAVGDFVRKVSPASPRPKKLKTKPSIVPPFTPPI